MRYPTFVRLYLHFFLIDMLIGVVLLTMGLLSPSLYVDVILMPSVATVGVLETLSFELATVIFAIYVFKAGLDKRLYAYPAYVVLTTIALMVVFDALTAPGVSADTTYVREAFRDPVYLRAGLACSVTGLVWVVWTLFKDASSIESETTTSSLQHLRQQRRIAEDAKR